MASRIAVWCCAAAVLLPVLAYGQEGGVQSSAELSKRLDEVLSKVEAANKRAAELEATVTGLEAQAASDSEGSATVSGKLKALEEKVKAAPGAEPSLKVTPYGQVKVDMAFDNSRTNSTDDASYVLQESPGMSHDKFFALTVRQTQLGLNIQTPDFAGAKSRGKIETDFYAMAVNETKPQMRLRYAYWELSAAEWGLLVGQAPDVMSPLAPLTLNRPHLDQSGNIGYRRPMVRYRRNMKLGESVVQADLALARGAGTPASTSTLDDPGSDAGWPVVEGRSGLSVPTALKRPFVIGVSGHVGQEEYDRLVVDGSSLKTVSGKGKMYSTYSGNIDLTAPLSERLDLTGEFFIGRNLDDFVGGIGQGVNTLSTQGVKYAGVVLDKPIDAIGGWVQLCYRPTKAWTFEIGGGIDDPDNSDLSGALNRSRNLTCFANGVYGMNEKVSVGLETAYMQTDYLQGNNGTNVRVQSSLIYKF